MPKREVILQAALELFLEQGYERTSLKQIVARTGGSLATVYKLFGSKNQLFFEAVKYQHKRSTMALCALFDENKNLDFKKLLELFGRGYLTHFCAAENIKILKLIITRIYADKELALRVQNEKNRPVIDFLTDLFEQKLICEEFSARQLAQNYMAILHAGEFSELLWTSKRASKAEIAQQAKKASEFFLLSVKFKKV